jgi:large subunit ribosomal protein L10
MPSQQILQEKIGEVEEITELINQHKVIGIANLQKVRAAQLQELKKNLSDKVYMRVIKNTLIKRAIETDKEKTELKKLGEHITGSNAYLFTDLNPFRLVLLLERGKVKTTAKAGDIAAFDVIVPAGNTGQAPGPIISQLNSVGLPTRIESGSVWINKDTLVVRKDEAISERLASLLSKLGIKPVEAGLSIKVAYDNGLIILHDQLVVSIDETKQNIKKAFADALILSLKTAYPTRESIKMIVQVANKEAYTLSLNASIPTKETIADLIRKAHMEMLRLNSFVKTDTK